MKHWLLHSAIFLLAQIVFAALGFSWPWEVITGQEQPTSIFRSIQDQLWTANTSRIWTIVWLADTVYTFASVVWRRQGAAAK